MFKSQYPPDIEQYEKDCSFGRMNEKRICPDMDKLLEEHFVSTFNRFAPLDFIGDNYCLEVKSRRTTMKNIGEPYFNYTKYKYFKENYKIENKKLVIVWCCEDADYYWILNAKECYKSTAGRIDRGRNEIDEVIKVRPRFLTKFNEKENVCLL